MGVATLRARVGRRRAYGWGVVDSAASSAANLGLSLLAGRILGPAGLGTLVVGFSVYLAMVSLQRSLVTTPLVSTSSPLSVVERTEATRAALTSLVVLGLAATAAVATIALLLNGAIARGLLVVVPWLLPSMVQDFWRAILFRDERPRAAACTTSFRLVTMIALSPLAWAGDSDAAVAAAWGAGFLAATMVGFALTRVRPAGAAAALRWWRATAWPFGRWLVAQESVFTVANYAITFILIGLIGAYAMGGLRAAETVFAPLSLLAPAIALPGLPALARAGQRSYVAAWDLALRLTVATVGLTLLYFATMFVIGETLLVLLYGSDFDEFSSLLLPDRHVAGHRGGFAGVHATAELGTARSGAARVGNGELLRAARVDHDSRLDERAHRCGVGPRGRNGGRSRRDDLVRQQLQAVSDGEGPRALRDGVGEDVGVHALRRRRVERVPRALESAPHLVLGGGVVALHEHQRGPQALEDPRGSRHHCALGALDVDLDGVDAAEAALGGVGVE